MKIKEYMNNNNLKTNEDLRLHFRKNLLTGKGICAMYSCPKCGEILGGDARAITTHKCEN